jgi:hypothetical protein
MENTNIRNHIPDFNPWPPTETQMGIISGAAAFIVFGVS